MCAKKNEAAEEQCSPVT